jgi:Tfp pilus assembly protein PilF
MTESAVLRARGYLARQDFAAAREVLHEAIARAPRALWPRVILTHAWLQEGRDAAAAERALLDVLELDPEHKEARHNLAVLRSRAAGAA